MKNPILSILFLLLMIPFCALAQFEGEPAPVDEDVVNHKNHHYNHHHPIHLRDHHEKLSVDVIDIDDNRFIQVVIKTHIDIGCVEASKPSLAIRLDNGKLVELALKKSQCGKLVEHPIFGKHNYVITYKLNEGQVNMLRESNVRNITLYGKGGKIYHDVSESAYGMEEKVKRYFVDNLM